MGSFENNKDRAINNLVSNMWDDEKKHFIEELEGLEIDSFEEFKEQLKLHNLNSLCYLSTINKKTYNDIVLALYQGYKDNNLD